LADTPKTSSTEPPPRKKAKPKGRRDLSKAKLPVERIEITDPVFESRFGRTDACDCRAMPRESFAVRQRHALEAVLADGQLALDNNRSERALRAVAVQ
jgi:hypothetical protein